MYGVTKKVITALVVLCAMGCGKNSEGAKKMENGKNHPVATIETSVGIIRVELFSDIAPVTVDNFIGLAKGEKEFTDPKSGMKVKRPFYDGLIFHRVIPDFMIQGGCPRGDGTGGPGYQFEDECYDTANARKITGKIESEEDAIAVFQNVIVPYFRSTKNPDPELVKIVNECQAAQSGKPLMKHDVEFYQKKTGNDKPLFGKGKLKAPVAYGAICMANSGPNTNGSQFFIVTKKDGCEWLNGKHTVFGKVISGMDVAEKIQNVERGPNDRPNKDVIIKKVSIE